MDDIIFGKNAIEEALISGREINKILISKNIHSDTKLNNIKTLAKENRVIVEGVNVVKKHKKGNGQESGGILEVEAPIHASNVMLIDPKTKKRTRIGHTIEKDKKVRVAKKSGEKID